MIPFQHPPPHRYTENSQQANEAEGSVVRESSFWLISQQKAFGCYETTVLMDGWAIYENPGFSLLQQTAGAMNRYKKLISLHSV